MYKSHVRGLVAQRSRCASLIAPHSVGASWCKPAAKTGLRTEVFTARRQIWISSRDSCLGIVRLGIVRRFLSLSLASLLFATADYLRLLNVVNNDGYGYVVHWWSLIHKTWFHRCVMVTSRHVAFVGRALHWRIYGCINIWGNSRS